MSDAVRCPSCGRMLAKALADGTYDARWCRRAVRIFQYADLECSCGTKVLIRAGEVRSALEPR